MGLIAIRLDDKTEDLIKHTAIAMDMNLSDYVRYKLNSSERTSTEKILLSLIHDFHQQKVELVQMRKELHIAIGAMIETLKPFKVTVEEMKQSGIDFYKAGENA